MYFGMLDRSNSSVSRNNVVPKIQLLECNVQGLNSECPANLTFPAAPISAQGCENVVETCNGYLDVNIKF